MTAAIVSAAFAMKSNARFLVIFFSLGFAGSLEELPLGVIPVFGRKYEYAAPAGTADAAYGYALFTLVYG